MSIDSRICELASAIGAEVKSKQTSLVSGANIKTINGTSVLGSGDITISGGSGTSDYLSLTNVPFVFSNPTAYSTVMSPMLVGTSSPGDSSSGDLYIIPTCRSLASHGGSHIHIGYNSMSMAANGDARYGFRVDDQMTFINGYVFPIPDLGASSVGKVLGVINTSGTLDWVDQSSGSGDVTQNVFIQSSEPTLDPGSSALWIQKLSDGSITFNLVEN